MEHFTLAQAAAWTGGEAVGEATLSGVSTDSRTIAQGALFFPLVAARDGHEYIGRAIEGGAAAVVSQRRWQDYPVPTLYVPDSAQALLDCAGGYRNLCGGRVVGITGSVGKTTTKELAYAVLNQRCRAKKTEGNLNNTIGLPLTLFTMTRETEVLVAEMGMNHFGELSRMTAAARPDIAVITNIGTSHIEFLGSRENICKAKLEILEGLQPGGFAVLNGDEPLLWETRNALGCKAVFFGMENAACDLFARPNTDGSFAIVNQGLPNGTLPMGRHFTARVHVAGLHNVMNALAAAAVGLLLEETPEAIAAGLAAYRTSGLRQNLYERDGFLLYADCYNASPESMEAALHVLASMDGGRRIAVLGSMLELGNNAEICHNQVGRLAAETADALYAYGPHAEAMVSSAKANGLAAAYDFDSHTALAAALRRDAVKGDALLFKGSRGMKMEKALALFLEEDVNE